LLLLDFSILYVHMEHMRSKAARSFLPNSACSHADQSTSSLSRLAHARYTRPAILIACLARDYPSAPFGRASDFPRIRQHSNNHSGD
jgi:hypothetical protein